MLQIKPFRQRTGFCGPASLKLILEYFSIKKTEKEIASLCGYKKSKGVEAKRILKAAKKMGLKGFIKDCSEIKDIRKYVLKKKVPVIVDWFSTDEGHYSVVVDIDKENIYLQDPELGRPRAMRIGEFKRVWFDFPGDFLKSKDEIVIRRLIVLYR